MLRKTFIFAGVLVALFLIYVATRPDMMHVERKTTINAPAEVVFPFLNDFKEWSKWNPWDRIDPGMKRTYSETTVGVGAWYSWQGNDQVGEGKMTIVESKPNEKVAYKLEFIKPFAATNSTSITLQSQGSATNVTWAMEGKNDFMMKLFCVFMDMDKAIGGDFEKGLSNLKELSEAKAKEAPASQPVQQ